MVLEFTNNIEDIVTEYINGATQKELQQKYNIGSYKLKAEIKKVTNIRRKGKDHLLDKEYIEKAYIEGISSLKLAKIYNVTPETIRRCLRELGISIRDDYKFVRQYNINDYYFQDINTKDKAYWLGWMFSDGYIKRDNAFGITLNKKDRYILELFARYLNADSYNIINIDSVNANAIHFTSQQICNDLNKYGVVQNKSLILEAYLPDNKELISHFVRGVFDGDGSIGFIKGKKEGYSKSLRFRICGGSYKFLECIKNYLIETLGVPENKINKTKDKQLFNIEYGGNLVCSTIYEWLYKDCGDLYLPRKRQKYDDFISTYTPLYGKACVSVKHLRQQKINIVNKYIDQGLETILFRLKEAYPDCSIVVLRQWLNRYLKTLK